MLEIKNNNLDDKLYSIEKYLSYPIYNNCKNMDSLKLCNSQKKQKFRKKYYLYSKIYKSLSYFNKFI